ncbi:MAG: tRNA pseudouridine(38-40) synthase TruA [Nitrospirae bacterium]|nr:tRNA pseudouridine(38-40) synthase TruA [Nitrospirota bacterium]
MGRVQLTIAYHGAAYCGWQVQPGLPTIQGTLQAALAAIEGAPVHLTASGRTDTGVHALAQSAHFDTTRPHSADTWRMALNAHLPPDIAVLAAHRVPDAFHARYSAIGKHYRYRVLSRNARCPFRRDRCWFVPRALDVDAMRRAAAHLLGRHDFTSLRAGDCAAASPVRTITRLDVRPEADEIVFDVEGEGFLKQMVRNITGTLVHVGQGRRPPEWIPQMLAGRHRAHAGETAPAWGLALVAVHYPPHFGIGA